MGSGLVSLKGLGISYGSVSEGAFDVAGTLSDDVVRRMRPGGVG